ncbi:MAG: type 2 isopentenyl-diphosphate Delta-isomerase [Balneolales bacterium]|nr:type 2 isopentenyl-diphosphate Delta-isomerase [Balneolales bacterium]
MNIEARKKDHVRLCAEGDVSYQKSAGFDLYDFRHKALPEVNLKEIDTSMSFLGKTISFPLFISSMTGGYTGGGAVNAIIAAFCEKNKIPFGVGSQRVMLENPDSASSFSLVRDIAPTAFIAANIGGCQLIENVGKEECQKMIDCVQANALIIHLNPLQELMQPEGDTRFRGILNAIRVLCGELSVPMIVKETGAGIDGRTARQLYEAGIRVIDTAGAGGTSWAKVENDRKISIDPVSEIFNNWGIPTTTCIQEIKNELGKEQNVSIIASGGITGSLDLLKAICLGATLGGSAQPVIKAVIQDGEVGLQQLFDTWKKQFTIAMCLLGCDTIEDLGPDCLIPLH